MGKKRKLALEAIGGRGRPKTTGDKISLVMLALNYSQVGLATDLGIQESIISKAIRNRAEPSHNVIRRVARHFGCKPGDIYGEIGPRELEPEERDD